MRILYPRQSVFLKVACLLTMVLSVSVARAITLGQAVDATNFTWTTYGDADWFGQTTNSYDGVSAAQSGAMQDEQSSVLQTTIVGPGTVTFYWETLGQDDEFDLEFDANGDYVNDITAQTGWSQQTFQLLAGTNLLVWTATTGDGSSPSDAGFLGDVVFTPPPPPPPFIAGTWLLTSNMVGTLYGQNLVLLTNGMAFSYEGSSNGNPNSETETVQLFNPLSGTWAATTSGPVTRLSPLVVTLTNGNVLACGGVGLTNADIYNAATAIWSPVNSPMSNPHYGGTITLLANGKALAVGGDDINGDPTAGAEIYNPTTQSWTPTTAMADSRSGHTATLLTNGLVLVASGVDAEENFLTTGYLYNPANGMWSNTGPVVTPRGGATATLLNNGHVLVAGGFDSNYHLLSSSELYDPVSNTWTSAGNMVHLHTDQIASLLTNGMVLIAGGADNSGATANAEIYNPTTGIWGTTSSMQTNRSQFAAVLLKDGRVLAAGGYNGLAVYASAETFSLTPAAVAPPTNLTIKIVSTNVSLTFSTFSNQLYDIQSTTNLVSVPWSTIASNLPGTGAVLTNLDVGAAKLPRKFYRVGVQE